MFQENPNVCFLLLSPSVFWLGKIYEDFSSGFFERTCVCVLNSDENVSHTRHKGW